MDYNPARKSLGNFLTKIIRVMQNIGFTTSQDSTTIAPENLGATVDKWIIISELSVQESQWCVHFY